MKKTWKAMLWIQGIVAVGILGSGCQPQAEFAVSSGIRTAPAHVQFENSSAAGLGTIRGYLWDFGDGTTSVDEAPAHVYEREGVYTVKLTVYGTGGTHTLVKVAAVVVSDDLPLAAEANHGGCYLVHAARPWARQEAQRYDVYASVAGADGRILRSLPEGGFGSRNTGVTPVLDGPVSPQLALND